MIRRVASAIVLLWALGFAAFAIWLPGPAPLTATDGIIVMTGGEHRIERGLALLGERKARRLLVSGVNRTVRPRELAVEHDAPPRLFACCVDLGREAVDTRTNGEESAEWVRRNGFESVRLVTTDWHMPRARFELGIHLDEGVTILSDAVASEPDFMQLFAEYNKYLLRRAAYLIGI
ncbi:MAG: YdcF family protein [Sphingomonadaceae bacterium]|nr:YdcF family protein [Sphingomonadaceae bacterium]